MEVCPPPVAAALAMATVTVAGSVVGVTLKVYVWPDPAKLLKVPLVTVMSLAANPVTAVGVPPTAKVVERARGTVRAAPVS